MITEIILIIFAIVYYLFSVTFLVAYMQVISGKCFPFEVFCLIFEAIFIAPIVVPVILGIELGEWLKNN